MTHVGFADESSWNDHEHGTVALITARREVARDLEQQVRRELAGAEVKELAWKRLGSRRSAALARKILELLVQRVAVGRLRVDVVRWDTRDARHAVAGRDDAANLERMYFHLVRQTLDRRWDRGLIWHLFTDQRRDFDWREQLPFLHRVGGRVERSEPSLFPESRDGGRPSFQVSEIAPCASGDLALVQCADLLAGLVAFSWNRFEGYRRWRQRKDGQRSLFQEPVGSEPSRRERHRFPLLDHFHELCRQRSFAVSLRRSGGLKSLNPSDPMNFWAYTPQHERDKAPVKTTS